MKRYYGFEFDSDGCANLNEAEAAVIKIIFSEYLNGLSLGCIAERLRQYGFPSPSGKETWSRSSIDNILTKGYYTPVIVSFEDFTATQFERQARSNTFEDTGKRKATRYHSKNELSGLLLCSECSAPYRRITRHSGEVVWRCANRVEHGKKICQNSPTVTEHDVYHSLQEAGVDVCRARKQIQTIEVHSDRSLMPLSSNMEQRKL